MRGGQSWCSVTVDPCRLRFWATANPNAIASNPVYREQIIRDFRRISQLLELSLSTNHHANGGPVAALLERIVALTAELPRTRACGSSGCRHRSFATRLCVAWLQIWEPPDALVTSAFTFFSAAIGPLSDSLVIDCAPDGGFSLERLKALSLDSYDGVVLTNLFAQCSNWDDVAKYCQKVGKAFVVDNATGLLDRPKALSMKVQIWRQSLLITPSHGVWANAVSYYATQMKSSTGGRSSIWRKPLKRCFIDRYKRQVE